jgi:hypothetical protein
LFLNTAIGVPAAIPDQGDVSIMEEGHLYINGQPKKGGRKQWPPHQPLKTGNGIDATQHAFSYEIQILN